MQHIQPLPDLAAEMLAEQGGDVGLVVDHQMLTLMPLSPAAPCAAPAAGAR
jgi:hypothetical protein